MLKDKKFGLMFQELSSFYPKIGTKSSKIRVWDPGSENREPGSGKNQFRIPDPRVKKAPVPDP
jgi:hypothetical protein